MKIVFVVLYRYAVTLLNTTYSLLILDYFLAGPVPEAVGSGKGSSRQFSSKNSLLGLVSCRSYSHKGNLFLCVLFFFYVPETHIMYLTHCCWFLTIMQLYNYAMSVCNMFLNRQLFQLLYSNILTCNVVCNISNFQLFLYVWNSTYMHRNILNIYHVSCKVSHNYL